MQILINGILLGAIYALLGVGMSMMFGIVKLTNLAHGEFIIMGAFGSTILSSALGINPILTLVVTVPVMFLLGMVLQSVLINRVMLRGAEPALLVTFGLSIILKDAMLLLFTADAQKIGVSYATASLNLGGISISVLNLVVFAISLITILVLTLFLRKTYMGRAIRATSDDTVAASLMGVSVKKTYGVAMGIAMATAAIARIVRRHALDLLSQLRRRISAHRLRRGGHRRHGQYSRHSGGRPGLRPGPGHRRRQLRHVYQLHRPAGHAGGPAPGPVLKVREEETK